VPYTSVSWNTLATITGVSRINVTADWVSMRDAPFQVPGYLPAQ
jgi:hypothetical protein